MTDSPVPGTPQTSTKALVAAVTTFVTALVGWIIAYRGGAADLDLTGNMTDTVVNLGTAAVTVLAPAVVSFAATHLTPNKPKAVLPLPAA